jgi:serine/threonine-protein kinase
VTEVDARSDLYSVGVMLYQMMTRKLPFSAHTPLGVVLMHLNEKPRPPSELAQVDPRLEAICLRAMSKDPNDRYATARDMRAALLLSDVAPESLPIAPSSKRKLALVVEQSVVTQTATTMAAPTPPVPPMRPPMSSAKEILAMEVPKRSMTPLLLVLLVVAIGGGGTYYMVRRSAQRAAAIDPPAPTVSLGTPSGTLAPVVPSGAVIKAPLASASTAASASAMASASASAATSASVGPIPPRPTDTGVAVSATASASVAPPPPGPPSPLHVVLGAVSAEHLNVATLTGALPVARFERCYREGVGANAKPPVGFAKLHIVMTSTSTEASFSGPQELATIGACVVAAANRMNIDVPSGGATADADLTFKTD